MKKKHENIIVICIIVTLFAFGLQDLSITGIISVAALVFSILFIWINGVELYENREKTLEDIKSKNPHRVRSALVKIIAFGGMILFDVLFLEKEKAILILSSMLAAIVFSVIILFIRKRSKK